MRAFCLLIVIILLMISCDDSIVEQANIDSPGVIFTFDDHSVTDWVKANSIYSNRNWKATFNISNIFKLSQKQVDGLFKLQASGNEIAFHGTEHIRAAYYLQDHTAEEYNNYEILPGLSKMKEFGFKVTLFACPGGIRNTLSDSILFQNFSLLRGKTFFALPPNEQKCFTTIGGYKKLVYAIGLDNHYEHMHLDYIESLLQYAVDENKIVLFYGHHIKDDDTTKYVTSYKTLDFICDFVEKHGLKFYTLSEVVEKKI